MDEKLVIMLDPTSDKHIPEAAFRINRNLEKQYAFDFAFDEYAP
jgi:hypothetical protein